MGIRGLLSDEGSHNTGYPADFDFDDVPNGLVRRIADVEPFITFGRD